MSVYVSIDSQVMNACKNYREKKLLSDEFSIFCDMCAEKVISLEDQDLMNSLYSIRDKYSSIFWYPYEEDEKSQITDEIENETREELMPYVEDVEKLIIRGTTDGDPVTEEERTEWWKQQKEREREEFYNRNGYYDDV
jgi:hypothetical protein